jgi:hypothetical protein
MAVADMRQSDMRQSDMRLSDMRQPDMRDMRWLAALVAVVVSDTAAATAPDRSMTAALATTLATATMDAPATVFPLSAA